MPNTPAHPQISLALSAKLFPDGAAFNVTAKNQFHLFTCQLVNTSATETYRISKWGTPLMADEFFQPLLDVIYEPDTPAKRVVLKGDYFHTKPSKPRAEDCITLAPGERSEAFGFRVIDIFSIKHAGLYSVAMTCHFQSVEIANSTRPATFDAPMSHVVATSKTLKLQLNVTDTPTSVQVFNDLGNPAVIGANPPPSPDSGMPVAPVFSAASTDTQRIADVTEAHYLAHTLVRSAITALSGQRSALTNAQLDKWFGTHTDQKVLTAVLNSYKKILTFMQTEQITYDFAHPATAGTDNVAFVTGIGKTWNKIMYMADGFWHDINMTGADSQSGTIVHELAHGVDMAQDYAEAWYGAEETERMATLSPAASVMHADALGRFGEAQNPLVGHWQNEAGDTFRIYAKPDDDPLSTFIKKVTASGEQDLWSGITISGTLETYHCFLLCFTLPDGAPCNGYLWPNLDTLFMYFDTMPTQRWTRYHPRIS